MARSPSPCRTVGFTPRSVVVGVTPASATFRATASRCTLRHWELSLGPYDYYTYLQSPRASIGPARNAAAGPKDVIVDTCNSEFDCTSTLLAKSFTLKRRTTWQTASVNATPEPARRGSTISLRGRLLIVNWDARRYVGYGGRTGGRRVPHPHGRLQPGQDGHHGRQRMGPDHRARHPDGRVAGALRRERRGRGGHCRR